MQNLASIQPRTSTPKFAEASKRYPPPVVNLGLETLASDKGFETDFLSFGFSSVMLVEKSNQYVFFAEAPPFISKPNLSPIDYIFYTSP